MIIPISFPEETITRQMVSLSYKHNVPYKEAWNKYMTDKQKRGYSFEQIYEYMIVS